MNYVSVIWNDWIYYNKANDYLKGEICYNIWIILYNAKSSYIVSVSENIVLYRGIKKEYILYKETVLHIQKKMSEKSDKLGEII